jgi:hypothetical protein
VLREAWEHQQHSAGEPFWFASIDIHLDTNRPELAETVRDELPRLLRDFESEGYIERVGETRDSAHFPLYRITSSGIPSGPGSLGTLISLS